MQQKEPCDHLASVRPHTLVPEGLIHQQLKAAYTSSLWPSSECHNISSICRRSALAGRIRYALLFVSGFFLHCASWTKQHLCMYIQSMTRLPVCVCVCVCVFIYLYVYVLICLHVSYLYIYIFIYVYIYMFIYLYIYIFICLYIYIFMYL